VHPGMYCCGAVARGSCQTSRRHSQATLACANRSRHVGYQQTTITIHCFALTLWRYRTTSIAVLDRGNWRVVILNRKTLQPLLAFGSRGRGPGELESPQSISFAGATIAISDAATARIAVFDKQGRHLRSVSTGAARASPGFAMCGDTILLAQASPTHYLMRSVGSGDFKPFAPRSGTSGRESMSAAGRGRTSLPFGPGFSNLVFSAPDDDVIVIDNDSGRVELFRADGVPKSAWPFPADLRDSILRVRRSLAQANPGATVHKAFAVAGNWLPTGELFLFTGFDLPTYGVILNVKSGAFRSVRGPPDLDRTDPARSAWFDGDRLYVLYDDGIVVFQTTSGR